MGRYQDLTGKRFGRLVVIGKAEKDKWGSIQWQCLCECDTIKPVLSNNLTSKRPTKSCGNCENRINGVRASFIQIEIARLLEINNKHINYKVGSRYIDIAIPNQRIAIEYDCWYWHGNSQEKDRQRAQEIIDLGWNVLSIKSSTLIPDRQIVEYEMSLLSLESPYRELILDDWGKEPTKFE